MGLPIAAAVFLFGFLLVPGTAHAAAPIAVTTCGEAPTAGGDYYLAHNIGPCHTDPALTLDASHLDMRGHTITGDGTGDGVRLIGSGSVLEKGTIRNTHHGVLVGGTGGHIVTSVSVFNVVDNGFEVEASSPGNILKSNKVVGSGDHGFHIRGDNTLLANNRTTKNHTGYDLATGSSGSKLWSNRSVKDKGDGIVIDGDGSNSVVGNKAIRDGGDGFVIRSDNNTFIRNTSASNKDDGFDGETTAGGNVLGGNKALKNGDNGLELHDGSWRIVGNTVLKNKGKDLVDADDCGTNIWEGNRFKTSDPAGCVQPAPATATLVTPACGDTISASPGDFVFLNANVGPCDTDPNPALTVPDGVHLDMRKHSVTGIGGTQPDCIVLTGTKAVLENGTVSGCRDGVSFQGTGGHIVRNVKSNGNERDGFWIGTPGNIVAANRALANPVAGFAIEIANDNVLWSNLAQGSTNDGYSIDAPSAGNIFGLNRAVANANDGFGIAGDSNLFIRNTATKSGSTGDGFGIDGDVTGLYGNTASSNKGGGIRVDGTNEDVVGNTALKNIGTDLTDLDVACTGNRWERNRFKTSDPVSCIS